MFQDDGRGSDRLEHGWQCSVPATRDGGTEMWISADGVAHTVALPDWRVAVGGGRGRLEVLSTAERSLLETELSSLEKGLFAELDNVAVEPDIEDLFVERVPPPLRLPYSDQGEVFVLGVVTSIVQADIRWRLDYLLAIQDACGVNSTPPSR